MSTVEEWMMKGVSITNCSRKSSSNCCTKLKSFKTTSRFFKINKQSKHWIQFDEFNGTLF